MFKYIYKVPDGQRITKFEAEQFTTSVTDMRSVKPFTLTQNGFQLERLPSPAEVQWDEEKQNKSVYYPMMEKLMKKATGASRVHIFDHTLRKGTIKEAKHGQDASPDWYIHKQDHV